MSQPQTNNRRYVSKQKVTSVAKEFRPWKEWKEGDIVLGRYISTHVDQFDKPGYVIEVFENWLKDKKADFTGKNIALNSTGMLNKAMEKIEIGQVIQVTYKGTSQIEKGKFAGKDSHVVEVEIMGLEDDSDMSDDVDVEL